MPPRHVYWTIIVDDQPTAFRAADREELLPTFNRLKEKHPSAIMRWFERGKLWDSPEAAREQLRSEELPHEPRGKSWRPGGNHRDPREKYQIAKKAKWARLKERWRGGASARPKRDDDVSTPDRHRDNVKPREDLRGRAPADRSSDRPFEKRGPARPRADWKPRPEGAAPRSEWKPRPEGSGAWRPKSGGGGGARGGWKSRPEGREGGWKPKGEGRPAWKPKPEGSARGDWKPAREGRPPTGGGWKPRPEGGSRGGWKPRNDRDERSQGEGGWKPARPAQAKSGGWKPKGPGSRPAGAGGWKPKGPGSRPPGKGGWKPNRSGSKPGSASGWRPKGAGGKPTGGSASRPKGPARPPGAGRRPLSRDPRKRGGGGGGR